MESKRDRKPNFNDSEVRCLLETVLNEKEVILSKFNNSLTTRSKKEAWGRVMLAVNSCGNVRRSEEDVKKKWMDLKSAALREEGDQKKTGGGGPMKDTPYKELIFTIIGDRSDSVSGIEGIPYKFVSIISHLYYCHASSSIGHEYSCWRSI
jgi:hypothetical protein